MFSSVICPVDFSDQSVRALRLAAALASHGGGRLTVIHVAHPLLVEAAAAGANVRVAVGEIEAELREVVRQAVAPAGEHAPQVDVRVMVGDAAGDIVTFAADHAASLIVMGTYGLTGYRKMLLGSVAERVLRRAAVPVLVVPQMEPETIAGGGIGPALTFGRILAPCDFSDRAADDLRVAQQMAATFKIPLVLIHVVEEVHVPVQWQESLVERNARAVAQAQARLDAIAAGLDGTVATETIVSVGSPAEMIGKAAAEQGAGLIVMGISGDGGRFGARPGTTAYRVLSMAAAPVLALPRPASA